MDSTSLPLIAVVGPTGSGKSELALRLAEELRGEIVNFDSVQVCRGLNIGSAKLALFARRGIRHHLIDCVSPDEGLTAGAYANLASKVIEEIGGRGLLPILVGGTGFYLRALLEGLSPRPSADRNLRIRLAEIAKRRPLALHRILACRDSASARRIHPNDHQKLIRAIELSSCKDRGNSDTFNGTEPRQALNGFMCLKVGLVPERHALYARLNDRTARMFSEGLLEETDALLRSGISPGSKAMQSLGYKQAVGVLQGLMTLEDAIAECQTRTRQYAKRQMTWFRKELGVHWLAGFGIEASIQREAMTMAQEFLGSPRLF